MPWMTDLRHFAEAFDPTTVGAIPAPARRLGAALGAIVEGVTAGWDDPREPVLVTARCLGRDGRRRCRERVVANVTRGLSDDDVGGLVAADIIEWHCLICGDSGQIHHWRGMPSDLTESCSQLFPILDVVAELELTVEEYDAVAAIPTLDAPSRRVLAAGRVPDDDVVVIAAPRAWLEHLLGAISAAANHTRSKKRRALCDALLERAADTIGSTHRDRQ